MRITADSPLILGSASPRRREIIACLGVPFRVVVAEADERPFPNEEALAYLERVVLAKLAAVADVLGKEGNEGAQTHAAILVADTSVIAEREILGKPTNVEDAARMLRRLSGRTHDVSTRFVIADRDGRAVHGETVTTKVTFRAIPESLLIDYATSGEGLDKAGAYAVQGGAQAFVSRIEGSYSNVVGLPACEVAAALESLRLYGSPT